ncbi:MAG: CvpA family protein [Alloprevotella sp.]|nr:CvpA family protein [Alloprevotella sp.]
MYIDVFLIILLLWSFYSGWKQGFLKEVVSALGFFLGLLIAATCYSQLGEYLTRAGSQLGVLTNVVAFLLLWIIVPIVLGFMANVLTKALKGVKLSLPNSLLGGLVSVLKYLVLLSCVLNVMEGIGILDEEKTHDSHLYAPTKAALVFLFDHAFPALERTVSGQGGETDGDTVWVDLTKTRGNG